MAGAGVRIPQPPWYGRLESALEPSYPLMVGLAAVIITITLLLVVAGEKTPLAAWLVYLLLP